MTLQTLVQPVGELMRKVAADVVLPYFRQLSAGDIEEKSPGDPVTIADRESEAQLAVGLSRLMPGIRILGEDAAATEPDLMNGIGQHIFYYLPVGPLDDARLGRDGQIFIVASGAATRRSRRCREN